MTVLRFRSQPNDTVLPVPLAPAAPDGAHLLLLDWSDLGTDCIWANYRMQDDVWLSLGRAHARIAVLHHRRWNRQSAYIGALLRLAGSTVRSFSSREREQAIHWLKSYNRLRADER